MEVFSEFGAWPHDFRNVRESPFHSPSFVLLLNRLALEIKLCLLTRCTAIRVMQVKPEILKQLK